MKHNDAPPGPVVTVIGAEVNRLQGHIALGNLDTSGRAMCHFEDTGGDLLKLSLHYAEVGLVYLDPDGAEALGAALADWAARRRPTEDAPLPGQLDLFGGAA